jgi:hypothetical protein
VHRYDHGDHPIEDVASQEGDDEKYKDLSGSLIHGM